MLIVSCIASKQLQLCVDCIMCVGNKIKESEKMYKKALQF